MLAKKDAVSISHSSSRGYQDELQLLYARRSAIDTLMRSLQDYDRYRALGDDESKRKLA
jgi:hypothetical protein